MSIIYIIPALVVGSIISIIFASLLLLLPDKKLFYVSEMLVSLAGGTLLGAAFLGMMPKAILLIEGAWVLKLVLIGILMFFVLEKVILWRACYNKDCKRHKNASAQLILIGDAFHNFIDGVVIVSAFYISVSFGIAVTISVFAHEVPQEIADFGILLRNGFSRKKAFWYNTLSGSTTLIGGMITYFTLDSAKSIVPYVLSLSAASFIYIALADLVPQMHQTTKISKSIVQIMLIIGGIGVIYLIKNM